MADPPKQSQLDKFRDLARELECNEEEDAFKAAVRKIGTAPKADQGRVHKKSPEKP